MFCFCFQSPFLKLQALEADSGPLPPPVDPKAQDNLPAQQQPRSSEEQNLCWSHKMLLHPSPSAQDQQTVDSSQPGKIITLRYWYTKMKKKMKVSELALLNICLKQRGNWFRSCRSTLPIVPIFYLVVMKIILLPRALHSAQCSAWGVSFGFC